MKHLFILVGLMLLSVHLKSQSTCQPPIYAFSSMTNVSGTGGVGSIYRFTNSLTGLNTFVTISKLQNASITNSNMDITGSYAVAWQPTITFTNKTNAGDSSYVEFKFLFIDAGSGLNLNSINNNMIGQGCMAMTIIDCDGPGNSNTFREMVKVSQTATLKGILNSTISVAQDANWISLISGVAQFSNIDTSNYGAMAQINFPPNTQKFSLRIGVVGAIAANSSRQFSFYFKSFTGLNIALPINLIEFNTTLVNQTDAQLNWLTASEQDADRFEIYRSFDGRNFEVIGSVNATGNSKELKSYNFKDLQVYNFNKSIVYYKLKMIETSGAYEWSNISKLKLSEKNLGRGAVFVSPNPSSTIINLDITDFASSDVNVEIVDIYGKCIQSNINPEITNNNSISLDISALTSGLYFVHLVNNEDGETSIAKFVKQ